MEIKNIKVGDKVRVRKDLSQEELVKLVEEHCIDREDLENLQTRGEVTVRSIQEGISGKKGSDWDSITLEDSHFFWPIELFEPVINKTSGTNKKNKEEQVQEDIQKIKDIVKRYGLTEQGGPAMSLIKWLEDFGQDNLAEAK